MCIFIRYNLYHSPVYRPWLVIIMPVRIHAQLVSFIWHKATSGLLCPGAVLPVLGQRNLFKIMFPWFWTTLGSIFRQMIEMKHEIKINGKSNVGYKLHTHTHTHTHTYIYTKKDISNHHFCLASRSEDCVGVNPEWFRLVVFYAKSCFYIYIYIYIYRRNL